MSEKDRRLLCWPLRLPDERELRLQRAPLQRVAFGSIGGARDSSGEFLEMRDCFLEGVEEEVGFLAR